MGNLKIPLFQYLVNNDNQAVLKADKAGTISDYAGGTNLLPGTATHLFRLEKELPWIKATQLVELESAVRVRKSVWVDAVEKIGAYTVVSTTASKGDVFRLVTNSLDLTPTVFQNIPTEKRYQLGSDCTTKVEIVAAIVAAINADPDAPVTAVAGFDDSGGTTTQNDEDKVILLNKNKREYTNMYVGGADPFTITALNVGTDVAYVANTAYTTVNASDYVNDYETLKNVQWVTDLHFDRNAEYYPEQGAKYNSYYFEVDWEQDTGGDSVPGQKAVTGNSKFIVYVKQGTALDTAMDAFATDMNV